VVEVDDEVSRHYSEIVVELRRAGRPIPTNDIWIAASAVRAGALLLTYDEHFAAIGRLGMIRLGES
jgi:predicted nucleic acid-binding protein